MPWCPDSCHLGPELPISSFLFGKDIPDSIRLARTIRAPSTALMPSIEKHSCTNCAQRKVKCDKLSPCSNCSKSQSECLYRAPALSQRHRKRPPDEDLLSKISEYEDLLRKNNVKFRPLDNSWVPSPLEEKLVSRPQTARLGSCTALQAPGETERPPAAQGAEQQPQSEFATAQSEAARLWSGLPKEVCGLVLAHPALGFC